MIARRPTHKPSFPGGLFAGLLIVAFWLTSIGLLGGWAS